MREYVIALTWDKEASVWLAINDDIPMALSNGSLDALIVQVQYAVPDVLQANHNLPDDGELQLRFCAERVERLDCNRFL